MVEQVGSVPLTLEVIAHVPGSEPLSIAEGWTDVRVHLVVTSAGAEVEVDDIRPYLSEVLKDLARELRSDVATIPQDPERTPST